MTPLSVDIKVYLLYIAYLKFLYISSHHVSFVVILYDIFLLNKHLTLSVSLYMYIFQ